MFTVPFFAIFGAVKNFLVGILSNPKILILIVILALAGYGVYKYNKLIDQNIATQKALDESESDNATLRDLATRLDAESNAKDITIGVMTDENKRQAELINKINKKNEKVQKDVEAYKKALNDIKIPPNAEIGPYLQRALKDVQSIREQQ